MFWLILEILLIVMVLVPTAVAFIFGAPFVPTPNERVRKMLELAGAKPGMRIYDVGCGDGRMVRMATNEFGADAIGFELSPPVFLWAKIRQFFWRSNHKIFLRDFRAINLSDADAIVCYLLPEAMKRLGEKLEKELKIGAKVVSYAFAIEGWNPTHIEPKIKEKNYCKILVYEIGKHR